MTTEINKDDGVVEKVSAVTKLVDKIEDCIELLLHCFGCKNEKKTNTLVKRDSVEVKRVKNTWQAKGICAKCGKKAGGFVNKETAELLGADVSVVPVSTKRKRAAIVDEEGPEAKKVTLSVDVKENKE